MPDNMDVDQPQQEQPLFLDVLAMTNDSRNTHGLRHQDYQRYRQYCARKIHRVRKATNLLQGKKRYERKDVTAGSLAKGGRQLEILLYEAERAWAYAMELKRESTAEPRKRVHLVGRLRKAAQAAGKLENICQEVETEARTALDVQAYAALMEGYVLFEQQQWQAALDKFAAARTIYQKLAGAGSAQQETLCQSAIDAIDPNIRYCAYNLKLKGGQTMDIAELVEMRNKSEGMGLDLLAAKVEGMLAQTRQAKAAEHPITWRGRTVPSRNMKLGESIMNVQDAVAELEKASTPLAAKAGHIDTAAIEARLGLFDKVLGACWEATKIAEADVKEDEAATAKVKSSKSDANTANLQFAFGYVSCLRLSKTIERNLFLIAVTKQKLSNQESRSERKGAKLEDIVKLYDAIIQSINDAKDLVAIQTDVVLQSLLSAKLYYFKAQRVYHIARIYAAQGKLPQAIALYDRAAQHLTNGRAEADMAQRAIGGAKTGKGEKAMRLEEDVAELAQLDKEFSALDASVRGAKIQEQAKWCLEAHDKGLGVDGIVKGVDALSLEAQSVTDELPLARRLDTFVPSFNPASPNLIDFPPAFEPIPCKPLFLDIAYNGVQFPIRNIERRAQGLERLQRGEAEDEGGKKGLMGVFSGLWGRK
ncbi:signal recognition particle subunit srp68 [Borealophlyctis nickersoniae]|nr:signal recognition particle subunit srp68 [Borealophlyctis nickersoniae]